FGSKDCFLERLGECEEGSISIVFGMESSYVNSNYCAAYPNNKPFQIAEDDGYLTSRYRTNQPHTPFH
ncbi:MAG TPA: hypothetical protein V6D27_05045, partial [Vampirovibrionales bacterium]